MKKEIGKCPYGTLQINDNKLEFVSKNESGADNIIALDLDKVWEDVKPFFIDKIKTLAEIKKPKVTKQKIDIWHTDKSPVKDALIIPDIDLIEDFKVVLGGKWCFLKDLLEQPNKIKKLEKENADLINIIVSHIKSPLNQPSFVSKKQYELWKKTDAEIEKEDNNQRLGK